MAARKRPRPKRCPDCGRPAPSCWIMPCLMLGGRLELLRYQGAADAVNAWLKRVGAPFTVEAKS